MKHVVWVVAMLALVGWMMRSPEKKGGPVLATTVNGVVEGTIEASGIRSFKGIPFARPPLGLLRFKEPQPVEPWTGVRKAHAFGPRAMQLPIYNDMQFRSDGVSEDCLYLNVWTPARSAGEHLPVLVYFYGGGFVTGDGSEYRYDGESTATKGIVTVTVNYRVGVFGFLAHPDLTKESAHHASGNYGLLDQHAALLWVQANIGAFGGDPKRVTIAGESAGSMAVSAQMASPLSAGLFAGAIGESGALLGNLKPVSLEEAEKNGVVFAAGLGNKSLADLRAMSAQDLLAATKKGGQFPTDVDGYFLPKTPDAIFAAGQQMTVPLLAGWNSAEVSYGSLLGSRAPTLHNYDSAVRHIYGAEADTVLKLYLAKSDADVARAATDLASDRFIAFSTWKWIDLARRTGNKPVYRYLYGHPRPPMVGAGGGGASAGATGAGSSGAGASGAAGAGSSGAGASGAAGAGSSGAGRPASLGAGHSWEIEYALGNLHTNKVYEWTAEDDTVSFIMQTYFAQFVKTGDPNHPGLPSWTPMQTGNNQVMVIDAEPHLIDDPHPERYLLLDALGEPVRR